jgi:hypothetical protein
MYEVPDCSIWINLAQVTSVEIIHDWDLMCFKLSIFMSNGKSIRMCGDWMIEHFMTTYTGKVYKVPEVVKCA